MSRAPSCLSYQASSAKHAAPCHPWHAASLDSMPVGVIRLMVGLPPAVPASEPHHQGRHAASETWPIELVESSLPVAA